MQTTDHPDLHRSNADNPIKSETVAGLVGACWLSRARGLPAVDNIRREMVRRHGDHCDFCDQPRGVLIDWLEEVIPDRHAPWRVSWTVPTAVRR